MAQNQEQEAPKITLYWLDQSRAQRIVWLLEELHLNYDIQTFHRNKDLTAPSQLTRIHSLGKSPIVTVTRPNKPGEGLSDDQRTVVLAETGWIFQYLIDHFPMYGSKLVPERWKEGLVGEMGGENDDWMKYSYYMEYTEGSLMFLLIFWLVITRLKSGMIFFLIRPFTSFIANSFISTFVLPNLKRHLSMIEQDLTASNGRYLCGKRLTAADIMLGFPLIVMSGRFDEFGRWDSPDGRWAAQFPVVKAYIDMLAQEPGYQRGVEKIKLLENGKYEMLEKV